MMRACTPSGCRTSRDLLYIHSANEPDLIAGVGTYSLEIIEAVPDLDVLIAPIGAGSGACGAVIAGEGRESEAARHRRASRGRAGVSRFLAAQ